VPGEVMLARQHVFYNAADFGVAGGGTLDFWEYQLHEVVPEPSTIVLLLCAAGTMLVLARRRK
jgi:hypothetical protein